MSSLTQARSLVFILMILFHQNAFADDGQFYGGSMSQSVKTLSDGRYEVTIELITGWVLGKGPCGPGCSKADLGRSTRITRPQMLTPYPQYLGNFSVDYLNKTTGRTDILDMDTIFKSSYNETVIAVSENAKWEQELLHFSFIMPTDKLDLNFDGYSWRDLSDLQWDRQKKLRWHLQTKISSDIRSDTGKTNNSPKSLAKPFYRAKLGNVTEIQIPVVDADGDFIKCEIATFIEGGYISNNPPPNVIVHKNCTVFIDASESNNYTDNTWIAVPVSVRDYNRHYINYGSNPMQSAKYSLSATPVQFVVHVLAHLTTPEFVDPTFEDNHVFILYAGTTLITKLYAEVTENTSIDSFTALGIQQETFILSQIQQDQERPRVKYSTLLWKPPSDEIGSHIACVTISDNTGVDSAGQRCFILDVQADAFNYTTAIAVNKPYFVSIPSPDQFVSCKVHATCVVAIFIKSAVEVTDVQVTQSYIDKYQLGSIQTVEHKGEQMYQVDLSFEHFSNGKESICFMAKDKNGHESENICIQSQIELPDPCQSAPCLNSGTCERDKDTGVFRCLCLPKFSGKFCQTKEDPCIPDPCVKENTLVCFGQCYCKPGFTGPTCAEVQLSLNGPVETYLKVPLGSAMLLNCSVSGLHPPNFSWTKLRGCDSKYESNKASTFIQSHATFGDSGTYICTASDGHSANVSSYFHVEITPSRIQESCDFDDGTICGWSQQTNDSFDWALQNGKTQSDGTGPDADHTLGTSSGKYLYIESSAPRSFGEYANLISPILPANRTICFEFWYYMFGDGTGRLFVLLLDTCLKKETQMFKQAGDQGQGWTRGAISVSNSSIPNDYRIVIKADVGATFHGDTSIDDLVITDGPCKGSQGVSIVG